MTLLNSRIKELRESKDLLQKEFAKKIGVSKPTVSAWEQGTRSPSANQRKKICAFFGISESELFGGQPIINPLSSDILEALQDPIAVEALLITHKGKEDIKKTIRAMLGCLPNISPEKRAALLILCK